MGGNAERERDVVLLGAATALGAGDVGRAELCNVDGISSAMEGLLVVAKRGGDDCKVLTTSKVKKVLGKDPGIAALLPAVRCAVSSWRPLPLTAAQSSPPLFSLLRAGARLPRSAVTTTAVTVLLGVGMDDAVDLVQEGLDDARAGMTLHRSGAASMRYRCVSRNRVEAGGAEDAAPAPATAESAEDHAAVGPRGRRAAEAAPESTLGPEGGPEPSASAAASAASGAAEAAEEPSASSSAGPSRRDRLHCSGGESALDLAERLQEARAATRKPRQRTVVHGFQCKGALSLIAVGRSTVVVSSDHCDMCAGHRGLVERSEPGAEPDYFPLDSIAEEATLRVFHRTALKDTDQEMCKAAVDEAERAREALAHAASRPVASGITEPAMKVMARGASYKARGRTRRTVGAAASSAPAQAAGGEPEAAASGGAVDGASGPAFAPRPYLGYQRTVPGLSDIRAAKATAYGRWGRTSREQVQGMLEELIPEGRAAAIPASRSVRPGLWMAFPATLEEALRLDPTLTGTIAIDDTFKAAGSIKGHSPQLAAFVGKSLRTAVTMPLAFMVRIPPSSADSAGGIDGEDVAAGLEAMWARVQEMGLSEPPAFPAMTSSDGAREYFIGASRFKARTLAHLLGKALPQARATFTGAALAPAADVKALQARWAASAAPFVDQDPLSVTGRTAHIAIHNTFKEHALAARTLGASGAVAAPSFMHSVGGPRAPTSGDATDHAVSGGAGPGSAGEGGARGEESIPDAAETALARGQALYGLQLLRQLSHAVAFDPVTHTYALHAPSGGVQAATATVSQLATRSPGSAPEAHATPARSSPRLAALFRGVAVHVATQAVVAAQETRAAAEQEQGQGATSSAAQATPGSTTPLHQAVAELQIHEALPEVCVFDRRFLVAGSADLVCVTSTPGGGKRLQVVEIKSFTKKPSDAERRRHWRQVYLYRDIIARELRLDKAGIDVALLHVKGESATSTLGEHDTPARPAEVLRVRPPSAPAGTDPAGWSDFRVVSASVLKPAGDRAAVLAAKDVDVVWRKLRPVLAGPLAALRASSPEPAHAASSGGLDPAAQPPSSSSSAAMQSHEAVRPVEAEAVLRSLEAFKRELDYVAKADLVGDALNLRLWKLSSSFRDRGIADALAAMAARDGRFSALRDAVPRRLLSHLSCEWHENQTFVRALSRHVKAPPNKSMQRVAKHHRDRLTVAWRRVRDARTGLALLAAFHVLMSEGFHAVAAKVTTPAGFEALFGKLRDDLRPSKAISWVASCRDRTCRDATNNAAEGFFSLLKIAGRRIKNLRHPVAALCRIVGGPPGMFAGVVPVADQGVERMKQRLHGKGTLPESRRKLDAKGRRAYLLHLTAREEAGLVEEVAWPVVRVAGGSAPSRQDILRIEPGGGAYFVNLAARSCTCDVRSCYEHRRWTCKHRLAAYFHFVARGDPRRRGVHVEDPELDALYERMRRTFRRATMGAGQSEEALVTAAEIAAEAEERDKEQEEDADGEEGEEDADDGDEDAEDGEAEEGEAEEGEAEEEAADDGCGGGGGFDIDNTDEFNDLELSGYPSGMRPDEPAAAASSSSSSSSSSGGGSGGSGCRVGMGLAPSHAAVSPATGGVGVQAVQPAEVDLSAYVEWLYMNRGNLEQQLSPGARGSLIHAVGRCRTSMGGLATHAAPGPLQHPAASIPRAAKRAAAEEAHGTTSSDRSVRPRGTPASEPCASSPRTASPSSSGRAEAGAASTPARQRVSLAEVPPMPILRP